MSLVCKSRSLKSEVVFNCSLLLRWLISTNGGGNLACCCEMLRSKRLSQETREIGGIINKSLSSPDEWVCIGNVVFIIVSDSFFLSFSLVYVLILSCSLIICIYIVRFMAK